MHIRITKVPVQPHILAISLRQLLKCGVVDENGHFFAQNLLVGPKVEAQGPKFEKGAKGAQKATMRHKMHIDAKKLLLEQYMYAKPCWLATYSGYCTSEASEMSCAGAKGAHLCQKKLL